MKRSLIFTLIVCATGILLLTAEKSFSQAPQLFKYDFLIRTFNGSIATNAAVKMRVSILDGSIDGTVVYSETHALTTDNFGMLGITVGNGTEKNGDLTKVDWSKGNFYLKMDELDGRNFMLMPTQKLLSVPYALYANKAGDVNDADADPKNELQNLTLSKDTLYLSKNGGKIDLNLSDNQTLSFKENKLYIKDGNYVDLPFNYSDTSALNEIQTISKDGNIITLTRGGGTITDDNTTYTAGEGLNLNGTQFVNTAPSKWVKNANDIYFKGGSAAIGAETINKSALLELSSTNQGFLPPRMNTQQRNAIANPALGLVIFNSETSCLNFYNGSNWIEICGSCTPQPTKADAGDDKTDQDGVTTNLSANTPVYGKGKWSVVTGANGKFSDENSPKTSFTGVPGTLYILRWSIGNECGTSTDDLAVSFWSCGFSFTDSRDDQIYETVKIGNQCWMSKNLNTGTMINGANNAGNNSIIEKYCYDDNIANCGQYGGLYQWDEMMQYNVNEGQKGICPDGWHVPSDGDWKTLEMALGLDQPGADKTGMRGTDQGTKLKEGGTSNFKAKLGGSRLNTGLFYAINNYGNFWTSTQDGTNAWRHAVSANTTGIYRTGNDKKEAISVRCIKN